MPVGINDVERFTHVVKIYQASQKDISYPIDKLKRVIKSVTLILIKGSQERLQLNKVRSMFANK